MDPDPSPTDLSRKKYDVFISFRGIDTRYNFTSHLHKALLQKNIETYVDDRLDRGDEIEHALLNAIEESKVSIIIFSENYASSSWCLDELVHILRCKEKNRQIVVPVFYHVTPSQVRRQSGSYGVAFAKLEERFKDKEDKLNQWRDALTKAAKLSGCVAPIDRYEAELVATILKDIMEKLNRIMPFSDDFNGLVGIDKRSEHVESLLLLDYVRILGIWGIGGMGKTTLAHAVFSRLYYQFEGHCFLGNIREEWKKHGWTHLSNKLFAQVLKEDDLSMVDMSSMRNRLCSKKLLIVLDDIDDFEKFEQLVGGHDLFSPESRIIITTRNKQVLKNIKVDEIYRAEQLGDDDALHLFCLNAFQKDSPTRSYSELSKKVVSYAAGMPLALKVLGSHLYSKSKDEWESTLNKLKTVPNQKIQNVLRISYDDGLDFQDQEIFIDIACFFKGKSRDFVGRILDDCGTFAASIRNLVDKSLITVHEDKLWMHDLVQEMGLAIIREQCIKEPGKRSRLWNTHDVCHVLKNNSGTSTVEGILLDTLEIKEDMDMKPMVFQEMYNLRLLKIVVGMGRCRLHLSQGLNFLPDALRYLVWPQYPLKSLPSSFTPRNLVDLDMPFSQIEHLWNGFQHLDSLRIVNLCFSKKLAHIPNLSRANLKSVDLGGCTSLVEVSSLRFQQVLDKQTLQRNEKKILNHITSNVWNLREDLYRYGSSLLTLCDNSLNLSGCSNLKTLSEMSGDIEYIYLRSTAIIELHHSIWSLEHLALLDLNDCRCLENLPSDTSKLESLKEINLCGCISINKFPKLPKNIMRADLSGTAIEQVPSSSFECLPCLEVLYLKRCTRLEFLSTSICKLESLKCLDLSDCSKLKIFPEILEPMERLIHLYLDGSGIEEIHWSIKNLIALRTLFLRHCKNLKFVPISIFYISHLEDLRTPELLEVETPAAQPNHFQDVYQYVQDQNFLYRETRVSQPNHSREVYKYYREAYDIARSISKPGKIDHSGRCYRYFANKIPQEFKHQSEGSSVHFNVSSYCLENTSIRLALCMVIEFQDFFSDPDQMNLYFECHFNCRREIRRRVLAKMERKTKYFNSNYLFIWNLDEKCNYIHDTVEVSFDFYIEQVDGESLFNIGKFRVKECGIKVLRILSDDEKISHKDFTVVRSIIERGFPHMDLDQPLSSSSRKKYDVFISFRGEDTRKGFTSHLQNELVRQNIETYIVERLVRGDEISHSLLDAIEISQTSIVIFSENYASSPWCLDELVHILHCKENDKQRVLPVFYNVNPSDVRKQGGSYAAAFEKHEQRYKDSIIHKWRTALTTAANLSGYDASQSRNESELIGNIVKDIRISSDYLDGLVGIDESIKDLKLLLFSSSSNTRKVGIWGTGGVGKTTLARAVYKQFYSQFEGQCFLDNVREKWKPNGPTDLQLKLFADLLKESTDQVKGNMQVAKESLGRKKLLIVLDDVDDDQQYRDLVEDYWLNSESKVILTSRDQQVLRSVGVNDHNTYNLKSLHEEKAFELFCLRAFKTNCAKEGFEEMSREFIDYAAGNPLALSVLGSHLIGKSNKEYWESMLNKLELLPDMKIHNILKISYDGLEDIEKEIFLDIACHFKGWSVVGVEERLDYRGCFAVVIGVLKDKCLINISDNNEIGMHDLLEEMGLEIVRHKEPEEQSRLWNSDNICDVLRNNTGTPRIEAIILKDSFEEVIDLEPDVFQKMRNLRLLQFPKFMEFQVPRGLHSFPNSIRYLCWYDYPLDSLGSHFTPCNLVNLDMPCSQLERLWNESKHNLENLKFIDLSNSKKLKCLPNLSSANLSRLDLRDCTSLVELPPLSFETNEKDEESTDDWGFDFAGMFDEDDIVGEDRFLNEHNKLYLKGCSNLKTVSEMFGNITYINLGSTAIEELHSSIESLDNLRVLDLKDCNRIKDLPVLPPNLKALNLSGTLIKQVDESSFEHLLYLEILDMNSCLRLETLPTCLCKLKSLRKLFLSGCSRFNSFPEILEPMKFLYELWLDKTGIKELPSSIENLNGLKILDLSYCKDLESIPTSICKLKSLQKLNFSGCSRFNSFPEILEPMEHLCGLFLDKTGIRELPSSIENLNGLQVLNLSQCKNLESIPTSIYNNKRLYHLSLYGCPRLKRLPATSFESSQSITVCLSNINILQLSDWHNNLSSLEMLDPSNTIFSKIPIRIIRKRNNGDKCDMSIMVCKCGYALGSVELCLDHEEVCNILTKEFCRTALHRATASVFKHEIQEADHPRINISYPGIKIPEWFIDHTTGSSIDINFSLDSSFLGFALCIVVGSLDNCFCNMEYWDLSCEYHFKTKSGGSNQYHLTLQRSDCIRVYGFDGDSPSIVSEPSHVFMWHLYEDDYHDYLDAVGASFKFHINELSPYVFALKHIIKECGVRRLTLQDAEEFGVSKHVAAQNINSDTNEPHPKRRKFPVSCVWTLIFLSVLLAASFYKSKMEINGDMDPKSKQMGRIL